MQATSLLTLELLGPGARSLILAPTYTWSLHSYENGQEAGTVTGACVPFYEGSSATIWAPAHNAG
jgi:hypothetical protein